MVTRKDFEVIAEKLRESRPIGEGITVSDPEAQQWAKDVHAIGEALEKINPRFDFLRFAQACQK